jgi:carbamoyl-phosphate synthase large subunit
MGFRIVATEGTAEILDRNGIQVDLVSKHSNVIAGRRSIVDMIRAGEIDFNINTPSGRSSRADGMEIRREAVAADKALVTTIAQVSAAVAAIDSRHEELQVTSLQEYASLRATW